ncbi:pyroglutamyl-peptidase I [Brachyspira hyodysenteriae]|uniref:Pyrrolidone-carboxylate peptidase n=2 Tax=Brachyspira hyodysenteriae TaxID=159 RepID=PCP_BRAHW|nr:pyroglutamyl-peptidase I [Brachyspira hyodysenteriae]C0QXM0.1 RecName: Full=Pyrrolidone-carboxylate peptidase; AltName: Full=5-oxoprolyl-peptidase; AltName: Full=Pyroglutamyl-peptidase I; Short=PGP-I; Short=Pyrase [Brachyspira hyodysenteriae WA1]ACN84886.1 pyrrolidone-carboxylate peptidase (N-terminal pyroglutamyl peptidase) [Brachyspira hyodysenteriae WA1]ANN63068.1 pyroglutamyl-peptidase I [Brachyspira hyodysenteriae ATCC 27164]AUJ50609.1 pyrrolidone-carboxylate peptidase [Brachyspira hyod
MKALITGFEPFDKEEINPSWEAVSSLHNNIDDIEIIKLKLPTVFKKSYEKLFDSLENIKPDIVICVGQAGGRYEISLERVAVNIDDAGIKDNEGNQPIDEIIFNDGENAYFSRLPIKRIKEELNKISIPSAVSNTAGTFVCNHIMYSLLYYIKKNNLNIKGGFIHVPYITEQILDKPNTPYMTKDMIVKALEVIIKTSLYN